MFIKSHFEIFPQFESKLRVIYQIQKVMAEEHMRMCFAQADRFRVALRPPRAHPKLPETNLLSPGESPCLASSERIEADASGLTVSEMSKLICWLAFPRISFARSVASSPALEATLPGAYHRHFHASL